MEEKFIIGEIPKVLHDKYSTRYKDEIRLLITELDKSSITSSNFENAVEKCLKIAQNISAAWVSAGFENKQRLHQ
ncbi:MAG: hypothetical protein EBZ95_02965 [Chitinophagia bacterium]|nr:hypothetical protein [Chitinophagia bacterium]